MVIWGKEEAWISKQHKVMRNFKGDGTITANKILEANECVCLCLWQWLRGVNRGISSRLQSLNTSDSHNWIKSVRLLLKCRCYQEHEMHLAPKLAAINVHNFSFSSTPWKNIIGENWEPFKFDGAEQPTLDAKFWGRGHMLHTAAYIYCVMVIW